MSVALLAPMGEGSASLPVPGCGFLVYGMALELKFRKLTFVEYWNFTHRKWRGKNKTEMEAVSLSVFFLFLIECWDI